MSESTHRSGATRVPGYRRQKCKRRPDRAYVVLAGKRHWLGDYNSEASRLKYAELLAKAPVSPAIPEPAPGLSVNELILAYLTFAERYYRGQDGKPSREYEQQREAAKLLRRAYGRKPARTFGPKKLKLIREGMIGQHLSRKHINQQVRRIVVMFRWAVEEELLEPSVHLALAAVKSLRYGRSEANESTPVEPVPISDVDATLELLPVVVADMVRTQLLTGARPSEICRMRPCDIDRTGEVWIYRPATHKMKHRGKGRIVAIGPKAQAVLLRYLARDAKACCFRPCDSEAKRRPGVKIRSRRPAGSSYSPDSYRRCIKRAAKRAGVDAWAPNRLRHTTGTDIRRRFGLEAAQVCLGHAHADVTQVYAERDQAKAAEVALKIG